MVFSTKRICGGYGRPVHLCYPYLLYTSVHYSSTDGGTPFCQNDRGDLWFRCLNEGQLKLKVFSTGDSTGVVSFYLRLLYSRSYNRY